MKLTIGSGDEAAKSESSGDGVHDDWELIYTENVMIMLVRTTFYTSRRSLFSSGIYRDVSRRATYPTHVIFTLAVAASDR